MLRRTYYEDQYERELPTRHALRDLRRSVMLWFGIVGVVCFALIPLRVYILNANDWLVYLLTALGVVFVGGFFVIWYLRNPRHAASEASAAS